MRRPEVINRSRRAAIGKIAEFAPVLFVLFFMLLLPCLNMIWLATAYVIIGLAANQFVSAAAVETTYDKALQAMRTCAVQFNGSPWTSFGGLSPIGGYSSTGSDLYLKSTNIASHAINELGPNTPVPPPVDTTNNIWEYKTLARYRVTPLLNMASVPFIGSVPGLGAPVNLTFVAHKLVEHPEGLGQLAGLVFSSQPNGSIRPQVGTGGGGVLPGGAAWYHPDIYELIAAAGQTIVSEDVLQVFANNGDWTDTGIDIKPGQKAWIDLRADGLWNNWPAKPLSDADGSGSPRTFEGMMLPDGALVGEIGASPLAPATPTSRSNPGGTPFEVGKFKLNLAPPNTGRLYLIQTDSDEPRDYFDNAGVQTVRVIITQ